MTLFPFVIIIMPFAIISTLGLMYSASYFGKHKIESQTKFFIIYWSVLILFEIIVIIFFTSTTQFIPPSFFINYVFGTIFFIIYIIECLSSNSLINVKIKFISLAAVLNYIIAPILLSFLKY